MVNKRCLLKMHPKILIQLDKGVGPIVLIGNTVSVRETPPSCHQQNIGTGVLLSVVVHVRMISLDEVSSSIFDLLVS